MKASLEEALNMERRNSVKELGAVCYKQKEIGE